MYVCVFRLNYGCNGNKGANRTHNGLPALFTSHPGAFEPKLLMYLRIEQRRRQASIESPVIHQKG